jgi:hypothetical protein
LSRGEKASGHCRPATRQRAISAPSCDSPPPHYSRNCQHTSTTTFLDTLPAYAYHLPYLPHLFTAISTSEHLFCYPLLQSLRSQRVGPPAISTFDCSSVAALDLRQTTSSLPGHCHYSCVVLRSVETRSSILSPSTCIELDWSIVLTPSLRLPTKPHLNHTSYKIDATNPRKSTLPIGFLHWIPRPMSLPASGNAVGNSQAL